MRSCLRLGLSSLTLAAALACATAVKASCPNFRPPLVPSIAEAKASQLCAGTPYEARVEALKSATPEADALREAEAGHFELLATATPFSWDGHICTVPYEAEHTVECALQPVRKSQRSDRENYLRAFSERLDPDPAAPHPPVQCATVLGALLADYTGRYNRAIVEHPRYSNKDVCTAKPTDAKEPPPLSTYHTGRVESATAVPDPSLRPSQYAGIAAAARFGDAAAVTNLIAAGARLDATDDFQLTALEWAVIRSFGDVQAALMDADRERVQDYCRALRYAVGLGRKERAATLLNPCAMQPGAVAANNRDALVNRAAARGDPALLRALQTARFALFGEAPGDFSKATPPRAQQPEWDWIEAILSESSSSSLVGEDFGADAQPETACPLHTAAASGKTEVVSYLLSLPVSADLPCRRAISQLPRRALHSAIRGGHADTVALLLQGGASATAADAAEGASLHYALRWSRDRNVVGLLIKHGAAIDGLDPQGLPALFAAARNLYVPSDRVARDALDLMLSLGADPNVRSAESDAGIGSKAHPNRLLGLPGSTRRTALMHAIASSLLVAPGWAHYPPFPIRPDRKVPAGASLGCLDQVKMLLAAGADPTLADSLGLTPLHYAARTDYGAEVAEALLAHGASVNARDLDGLTPLDHAAALQLERMAAFLSAKGGRRGSQLR